MSYYTKGTYYDLLEVGLRASQAEIEEAYRRQMEMLNGNSLATYGLFVGEDLDDARRRVEDAYRVLGKPARRRVYDLAEFNQSFVSPDAARPEGAEEETDIEYDDSRPSRDVEEQPGTRTAERPRHSETGIRSKDTGGDERKAPPRETRKRAVEGEPLELATFDGGSMRSVRERQGVSLEDISARSKINEFYLQCIEDERFSQLPPPIYLNSYIKQYAQAIGLDPEKAARGFLARYNEAVGEK